MDQITQTAIRRASEALRIASTPARREPRPDMARLFALAAVGARIDGLERELLEDSARAAGKIFDPYRWQIRWSWLRDQTRANDLSVAAQGGGYLVGEDVPAAYDALRPWSTVVRAGVQIMEGLVGNTVLPTTTAIGTPTWHAEETTAPAGNAPTVGNVVMTPKTVSNTIDVSRHLALMAPTLAQKYVLQELTRSIASAVDAAVLVGEGTDGVPEGMVVATGIATATGTSFAQATAAEMLADVAAADALEERVAFVGHPLVRKLLQGRERATGLGFIWDDDTIVSRPAYVSTAMAVDALVAADWSRVVLGLFGPGLELEITPFASSANFQAGIITGRAILSCDTGFLSPAAVCLAEAIT